MKLVTTRPRILILVRQNALILGTHRVCEQFRLSKGMIWVMASHRRHIELRIERL